MKLHDFLEIYCWEYPLNPFELDPPAFTFRFGRRPPEMLTQRTSGDLYA